MLRGPEYLNSQRKRDLDLIGGGLLALTLAIPTAVCAAAIYIEDSSEGSFYRQLRTGKFGQSFVINKLRTLRSDRTCGSPYTSHGIVDPRALVVGQLLRRICFDEVPQIVNIFRDEMSLVGYRPLVEADRQQFKEACPDIYPEWEDRCNAALPGLTGPSQLRKRNFDTHDERIYRQTMLDDIDYLRDATFAGDLRTIAQTPVQIMESTLRAVGIELPRIELPNIDLLSAAGAILRTPS